MSNNKKDVQIIVMHNEMRKEYKRFYIFQIIVNYFHILYVVLYILSANSVLHHLKQTFYSFMIQMHHSFLIYTFSNISKWICMIKRFDVISVIER